MVPKAVIDTFERRVKTGVSRKETTGLRACVETACAHSPYLKSLIEKHPDVAKSLAEVSPEDLAQKYMGAPRADSSAKAGEILRKQKQKIHLLCALCDIAGVWDWEVVTGYLSDFADVAMETLINRIANELGFIPTERGDIPGVFILGLGKYGGQELNYSSDIDLSVFYDPEEICIPEGKPSERILIRFVKKLMRGFDEITQDGYIFRTDLRLRPDPRANAIAVSTSTAERYYETLGQNWERAALIKARFVGGDRQSADAFLKSTITPFVWRRSLDYTAIADIHAMKRQMSHSPHLDRLSLAGHNVKLGVGGIREIEFFASVQQLILGGKFKNLRTPRTIDALQALADAGFVRETDAHILIKRYADLRRLEHRIQMYRDEQSHTWPAKIDERTDLVHLCGGGDMARFETQTVEIFKDVNRIYTGLFRDEDDLASKKGSLVFTGVEPEPNTLQTLEKMGFSRTKDIWSLMAKWLGGRTRATRTARARELLTKLAPRLLEHCENSGASDTAFFHFAKFIEGLNAGVNTFSMFQQQDEILKKLVETLTLAPSLAPKLARYPERLHAMVKPVFGAVSYARTDLYQTVLDDEFDYETAMNTLRTFVNEDKLNIAFALIQGMQSEFAAAQLSEIAQQAIRMACKIAQYEHVGKTGPLKGEYAVLGFGKLGGREMSLGSDVDLVLVYEGDNVQEQFFKLTRRLITVLSSVSAQGQLYKVDMALRPSGRSGPLCVPRQGFTAYYRDKAWVWEFMALARARVVYASSEKFATVLQTDLENMFVHLPDDEKIRSDMSEMIARLQKEKPSQTLWDLKNRSGGLRDIEFIAQFLKLSGRKNTRTTSTLGMLKDALKAERLKTAEYSELCKALEWMSMLNQWFAAVGDFDKDSPELPSPLEAAIVRKTEFENFAAFRTELDKAFDNIADLHTQIFGI